MGVDTLPALVAVLIAMTLLTWLWLPFVRRRVLADYERAARSLPSGPRPMPEDLSVGALALLAGGPARVVQVLLTDLYLTGELRLTRTGRSQRDAVALREAPDKTGADRADRADGADRAGGAENVVRAALLAILRGQRPAPLARLFRWGLAEDGMEPLWRTLETRGLRPDDQHLRGAQHRYAAVRLLLVVTMSLGVVVALYGAVAGAILGGTLKAGVPYLVAGAVMAAGSGLLTLWAGRRIGRISPRSTGGDQLLDEAREQYCRRWGVGAGDVPERLSADFALRRLAVTGSLGTHLSSAAYRRLRPAASPEVWPPAGAAGAGPALVEPPALWGFLSRQRSTLADFGPVNGYRVWRRVEVPQGPEFTSPAEDYRTGFFWQAPDHSH